MGPGCIEGRAREMDSGKALTLLEPTSAVRSTLWALTLRLARLAQSSFAGVNNCTIIAIMHAHDLGLTHFCPPKNCTVALGVVLSKGAECTEK